MRFIKTSRQVAKFTSENGVIVGSCDSFGSEVKMEDNILKFFETGNSLLVSAKFLNSKLSYNGDYQS